jgi:hypothetical protein
LLSLLACECGWLSALRYSWVSLLAQMSTLAFSRMSLLACEYGWLLALACVRVSLLARECG